MQTETDIVLAEAHRVFSGFQSGRVYELLSPPNSVAVFQFITKYTPSNFSPRLFLLDDLKIEMLVSPVSCFLLDDCVFVLYVTHNDFYAAVKVICGDRIGFLVLGGMSLTVWGKKTLDSDFEVCYGGAKAFLRIKCTKNGIFQAKEKSA